MSNYKDIKVPRKHLTFLGKIDADSIPKLFKTLIQEHETKYKSKVERIILHGNKFKSSGNVRIASLMDINKPLKIFSTSDYLHVYSDTFNNEIVIEGTLSDCVFLLRICVITTSKNKRVKIEDTDKAEKLLNAVSESVNLRNWKDTACSVLT